MDPESEMKRLEIAAKNLGEHFDSVQIFVTRHEPVESGGTVQFVFGCGNWFSRYGQVQTWLKKSDERTRIEVRQEE